MEPEEHYQRGARLAMATALYWILFLGFLVSFLASGNAISMALVSDRVVDAAGMSIAMASSRIIQLPPTGKFTYGYHRFESLSSVLLIIAFILLLVYTAVISSPDIFSTNAHSPLYTVYSSVLSLALLPIIAFLLHGDENMTSRTMRIHTLQDIITTALALVGAVVLIFYPSGLVLFLSTIIIIAVSVFLNKGIIAQNMRLLMEGTDLNTAEIETGLKERFPMVHHLHIWEVCRHYRLATVHVFAVGTSTLRELEPVRKEISDYLSGFGVNHLTIQFEPSQDD